MVEQPEPLGGKPGTGTLHISGGNVTSSDTSIGYAAGSHGNVTLDSGSLQMAGEFFIGNAGTGSLTVTGGQISSQTAYIGFGGSGTAAFSGGQWDAGGDINVGLDGNGTLSVGGNSVVTVNSGSGSVNLAVDPGSQGTLNMAPEARRAR